MTAQPDYAPEAAPSINASAWTTARRHNTALAVLQGLREGEDQLILEQYMTKRYGPRKAAVVLMMLARQIELAPWSG